MSSLTPPKDVQTLQTGNFIGFCFFGVQFNNFGPAWIRIRIPNLDSLTQLNPDPKKRTTWFKWYLFNGLDALFQPVREAECAGEAAHAQQEVLQHLLPLRRQIHLGKHKKMSAFLPFFIGVADP
jgi:hypothetical protein